MSILNTNPGVAVGNKPSILDLVVMQGAHDTPLLNMFKKGTVANTLHSWIQDTYEQAGANAQLEVSDVGTTPDGSKTKTSNATQIFKNEVKISYTQDAVSTYGDGEMKHQLMKGSKKHARDLEFGILGLNNGQSATMANAGADTGVFSDYTMRVGNTTAGKMAGIFGYIPTANRIDGASANVTYDSFCAILQKIWEEGGDPSKVYVGADMKKYINAFADATKSGITVPVGSKDFDPRVLKVSTDFGIVDVNIHRDFTSTNGLNGTILAGDFSEVAFKTLIATSLKDVATSETATIKRYFTEGTLEVKDGNKIACGLDFLV